MTVGCDLLAIKNIGFKLYFAETPGISKVSLVYGPSEADDTTL